MSSDLEVRIKLAPNIHRKWSNAATVRGLSLKGFISSVVSRELIGTGELNPATESGVSAATTPAPKQPSHLPVYGVDNEDAAEWAALDEYLTSLKKPDHPPTYDYDDKLLISKNTKPMPPLTDGESVEDVVSRWDDDDDGEE
jgi:hypothetical protein